MSHVISPKLRLNLYHTMVSPYMTYGNIVWASNYESRIHCFTTLQKGILTIIGGDNPRATTTSRFQETKIMRFHRFQETKIMRFYNLNMYLTRIFVYKFMNNLLPKSFVNYFVKTTDTHKYITRAEGDFSEQYAI